MEYLITFVVVGVILAVFAVKRLLEKAFYEGYDAGFAIAIKLDRIMNENAKGYAEIIRKEDAN